MTAKIGTFIAKVLAVVFTSIVAPVVVDLAVRDIHGAGDKPESAARASSAKEEKPRPIAPVTTGWQAPQSSTQADPISLSTPQTGEVASVIVRGVGRTPETALHDALRAALRQAVAAHVDADTWARRGQALVESMYRDSSGLILGWKELKSTKEWRLRGTVHHEEVAVRLNYRALCERLRREPNAN
jgi:hypothetical protein